MADDMTSARSGAWGPIVLLGRILFALVFILSSINHFNGQDLGYAAQAHLPMARLLVPLAGVLILIGGISVLLGYKTKVGAWLIVIFLVAVTPVMHNFWAIKDPMMHGIQMANFMRNVSMLGGALLIAYFGGGPWSLDRADRR